MRSFVIAYSFDPDTGEYTGEVNAWDSPLVPGEYLLPAHATYLAPPAPENGKFRKWNGQTWVFENIPAPPQPTLQEQAQGARLHRNDLLAACDWTQLPDVPMQPGVRQNWATYRQALRDVPQQASFPTLINWPEI